MYLVIDCRMSTERPLETIMFLNGVFDDQNKALVFAKDWFIGKMCEPLPIGTVREQALSLPDKIASNAVYSRAFEETTDHGVYLVWCAVFEVPKELVNATPDGADGYEIPLI